LKKKKLIEDLLWLMLAVSFGGFGYFTGYLYGYNAANEELVEMIESIIVEPIAPAKVGRAGEA